MVLSPLLMRHGLVMLTIGSSEELKSLVNAKRAGVVLVGPAISLVSAAHETLLQCEGVVPCVRLLSAKDLSPQHAALRLDDSLGAAAMSAALKQASILLEHGVMARRSNDEEAARGTCHVFCLDLHTHPIHAALHLPVVLTQTSPARHRAPQHAYANGRAWVSRRQS